ncbi:N-terminal kinase-like protein [Porphyridium purpureum]|uniref:N-terminal kinase-like protein n=1 Tax=Porphyridium purpureum TaxID=35688 RepID=A0A5J4Z572_PORPP|nr:N-terminal kinase-like protein [Porphyridium purpureum]|eukprot:POR8342..scf295_1
MQYFSSLFGSTTTGLGYIVEESIPQTDPLRLWELSRGVHKEKKNQEVLLWSFSAPKSKVGGSDGSRLAKNALQRLKTLRHPDVLKFVSAEESPDGSVQIATEFAIPLSTFLAGHSRQGGSKYTLTNESIQWGVLCISRALAFLHQTQSIHGRFNPDTILVTRGGDWKLAGFEATCTVAQASFALKDTIAVQRNEYKAPELVRGSFDQATISVDTWALGCVIYAVHCAPEQPFTAPEQLRNIQCVPEIFKSVYQKLLSSSPPDRLNAQAVSQLDSLTHSKYVELNLFLENLALKDTFEKEAFFNKLPNVVARLPDDFCVYKLLPILDSNLAINMAGVASLTTAIRLGESNKLSAADFGDKVVRPYVTKWYGNTALDRAIRMELVSNLSSFAPYFSDEDVNTTIFPAHCSGFADIQSPALRDMSVKAILCLADKLSDRNLNTQLMSFFAKLQLDPEAPIRTNTTVCLSKLAPKMSDATRKKVLVSAFLRALKDPFPPARNAGLCAFLECTQYLDAPDLAARVLPAVCPLIVDPVANVRNSALECVEKFLPRIQAHVKSLNARADASKDGQSNSNPATGAVASGGWALQTFSSAITGKLVGTGGSGRTAPTPATPVAAATAALEAGSIASPQRQSNSGFGSSSLTSGGHQSSTSVRADSWDTSSRGLAVAPASLSHTGTDPSAQPDEEDEEGWGDFMGGRKGGDPSADTFGTQVNAGASNGMGLGSAAKKAPIDDWDFSVAAPAVAPMTSGTTVLAEAAAATPTRPSSRQQHFSGQDDWGAVLGGPGGAVSGTGASQRSRNRAAAPKLGTVKRK